MNRFLNPFWIVLFLFSCDSGNRDTFDKETAGSARSVYFEKLDSIQIDYLGNPTVHDLDPVTGTVLFMEHKEFTEEILVGDFEGNIKASFSKLKDSPESYGALMATLRINGDSSFIAFSYNGFLTYNFKGELQSRIKLKEFRVPNFTRKAMGFGMEKYKDKYLYIDQGSEHIDYTSINAYEEIRLLNWLDPETGAKVPFIQFPECSIFRSGKYFFRDSWAPAFTFADDRIYVAFGIEPVIYSYNTSPPYSLVSSLPLDLPSYRYFKGADNYSSDWTFFGLHFTSGMIRNIKMIDGYILVAYFPGYDDADTEMRFSNKSEEETAAFNTRMKEKYPPRIAVLDSTGSVINDFVPDDLVASSMLVRNGELWMLEKPDEEVERDYFRLFRVGLKLVE